MPDAFFLSVRILGRPSQLRCGCTRMSQVSRTCFAACSSGAIDSHQLSAPSTLSTTIGALRRLSRSVNSFRTALVKSWLIHFPASLVAPFRRPQNVKAR